MPETYDLILKGGTVVNHDGEGMRDIGVRAGRFAAIGDLARAAAGEVVDCHGLHLLPGVVDTQVHFREPGLTHKEDLESGSLSAVMGGVTAVFEMPNTDPLTVSAEALADKVKRGHHRMHCDFAFFVGATTDNTRDLAALERLPGCAGIKVFMGSSTGSLLISDDAGLRAVLKTIRRRAAFHTEDEPRLNARKNLRIEGDPRSHPIWRDESAALTATQRLVAIAHETGARVHVLHVSTAQMNPPVRDAAHRAGLWHGLDQGVVDVLGSDHAPHTPEEKAKTYPASPSGMTGVQTLVPIMLDHVNAGRLTLLRFVDLTSAGPARLFSMAAKGRIAVGYDADLTVVDLKRRETIADRWIASRAGWTPYHGVSVTGWPVGTIVRGSKVMWEGSLAAPARGERVRFLETLAS